MRRPAPHRVTKAPCHQSTMAPRATPYNQTTGKPIAAPSPRRRPAATAGGAIRAEPGRPLHAALQVRIWTVGELPVRSVKRSLPLPP